MKRTLLTSTVALLLLTLVQCGSDDASPADNAAAGSGGGSATGGKAGTGGTMNTGGTNGSGGAAGTGGKSGTGGSVNTGGTTGADASSGTGGTAVRPDGGTPPSCPTEAGAPQPSGTPPTLTAGTWKAITPPGICSGAHFGCMDIQISPCNPYVIYLTTDSEGMWRSGDGGATWTSIGNMPSPVSPGVIAIDPRNPLNMYNIGGVRGASLGFWVSHDGGDTWEEPKGFTGGANNSVGEWCNDVYDVKADPADFQHVLLTFHGPWEWTLPGGVLESKDGGNTWTRHLPAGSWGTGHSVFFLGDSNTWLVGTQAAGYFRTSDAGATFTQVSTVVMQHGGTNSFVSKTGVLYVGAFSNVLRSTDNGLTFTKVAPYTGDGYYAIIGDGNMLYTQLANTGSHGGAPASYVTSPETDGTTWTAQNGQTFSDGPYRMAFDPVNKIIYSSNWNAGVWALKVE
jgi:hypothetical protein